MKRYRPDVNAAFYQSPCGQLLVGVSDGAIVICDWVQSRKHTRRRAALGKITFDTPDPDLDLVRRELDEYFAGERTTFSIGCRPVATPFQVEVLRGLASIPYGETVTYGRLAASIGRPEAVRAVASAVSANPVSIILPCHRVVPAQGGIGNYDGGSRIKNFLLRLESENSPEKIGHLDLNMS